jgi:hypothetical protein
VHREGEAPEFLAAVLRLRGIEVADPAAAGEVEALEDVIGASLPGPHAELLHRANGIVAAYGYERILGAGSGPMSIAPWNALETWKFAWALPLDDFLCIAETGFGDQYAYRISELRRGLSVVHRLERHLLEPADLPAAADFEAFMRQFFARAQRAPQEVLAARAMVGNLALEDHAVQSPPPLVAGSAPTGLVRLPAASAMILQGDLATQLLDPDNAERHVERLDTYQDDLDRPRLRIVWE